LVPKSQSDNPICSNPTNLVENTPASLQSNFSTPLLRNSLCESSVTDVSKSVSGASYQSSSNIKINSSSELCCEMECVAQAEISTLSPPVRRLQIYPCNVMEEGSWIILQPF